MHFDNIYFFWLVIIPIVSCFFLLFCFGVPAFICFVHSWRRFIRKKATFRIVFFGLMVILISLVGSSEALWAATHADTLKPDVDGNYTGWLTKTLFADEYEEIDDPRLTCGSASENTYLLVAGIGSVSSWEITNAVDTLGKDVDSAAVEWEMEHQTDGSTSGTAKVAIGWAYNYSPWDVCALGAPGYDTVEITDECVVYRVVWDEDPCNILGGDLEWNMFGFYSNNYYQPFIWSISVRTGCGVLNCENWCSNVRVIVYSTSTEDESGNIRRRIQWWSWRYDAKKGVTYEGDENEIRPHPWTDDWFMADLWADSD